ncbi:helix-turn-helix transcriptional regulator [Flagellimonas nanhaiensis]|uniref:AraC family transcriptional regulator n=1 Tax=Flagellimonas nanhaiensis TaxID=2292706 RepID=A0A371JQV4_9FLAO|nr:AraC family transcriptional regulator [Allomuricauda nanhaiensis]RDY59888.1 AraC family transcriptional regulator [Allomuricauda nanhaiensis]
MNTNKYFKLSLLDGLELLDARNHTLDFPFHTHDSYNISLIFKNIFNIKLGDKTLMAPRGSIAITNPSELHATPCDPIHGTSFFTFYIPTDIIKHLNDNRPVFFRNKIIENPSIFNQLYYLSLNHQNNLIDFEKKLLFILKILIQKYSLVEEFCRTSVRLLNDCIEEIDICDNFSLEKTAQKFGVNKFKFLRLFKQETGLTPTNFILLKRINRSKELLLKEESILDVAIASGFYDSSHFHRNFIKYTGITPSEYHRVVKLCNNVQ